jgi:glycosyltransferase involved in cell wall biosynthesis
VHVGLVIHSLAGGGGETVARRWIGEMLDLGHEVTVFRFDAARDDETPTGAAAVVAPRWARARRGLLLPVWLRVRVRQSRPDVLLSLPLFSNVVALLAFPSRRRPMPLVVSEHTIERAVGLARREGTGRVQRAFRSAVGLIARRVYRNADALIAVSHPVAADAIATYGLSGGDVFVVPNPAATDSHAPVYSTPDRIRLAYVGRMSAEKRPRLFLDVVAELRRRGCEARGTMFGDGPLTADIQAAVVSRDLPVELAGWQADWTSWPEPVDCLVLPSSIEGFGNVLVEAASVGIPSVASSRALAVADALVPGVTGELALLDTPASFADAVERAVSGRPDDGRFSLDGWLGRFSVGASTAALVAVLEEARSRSTHD